MIELDKKSNTPMYKQLYEQIKSHILSGQYKPHEKLLSKRAFAKELQISQTTVENALNLLLDEGIIYTKVKSGIYVSPVETVFKSTKQSKAIEIKTQNPYSYDIGKIDTEILPNKTFKKIIKDSFSDTSLFQTSPFFGHIELRQQLTQYLAKSRGVNATYEQVIIGSSTHQLLQRLFKTLSFKNIAIEKPSYPTIVDVCKNSQVEMTTVEVDKYGIDIKNIKPSLDCIHITPSNQYPTGAILSIERRTKLLQFAKKNDIYIIEDDYDSEFRYNKEPLPSIQGLDLDGEHVIYMGTFSKSLFPSLRIAYMVLPQHLLQTYYDINHKESQTVPHHTQHFTKELMATGEFERHIQRSRKYYSKKLNHICNELDKIGIQYSGAHTGMHIMLYNITPCNLRPVDDVPNAYILGIGGERTEDIIQFIHTLEVLK